MAEEVLRISHRVAVKLTSWELPEEAGEQALVAVLAVNQVELEAVLSPCS